MEDLAATERAERNGDGVYTDREKHEDAKHGVGDHHQFGSGNPLAIEGEVVAQEGVRAVNRVTVEPLESL